MKVRVIADGAEHVTEYSHPVLASQAIADSGVSLYAPCGGKGICGKCRVKIGGEYTPARRTCCCSRQFPRGRALPSR